MMVLDLQWVLFGALCLAVLCAGGLVWGITQWQSSGPREQRVAIPDTLSLLEQAPFGVLVLENTSIQYANTQGQRLLHLSAPSLDTLPSADWVALLLQDVQATHKETTSQGRYRNVTFASGRTVRWWVTQHGDRDLVILLDVSAEQRAQRTTRALISDLGHELRTPVATLLTHLEILGLDDVGEDVREQSLHLAKQEAQRMSRLISDILKLGRVEMAEVQDRRPVDVITIAEDSMAQMLPQARERQITLELQAPPHLPLVIGNDDRLREVFLNLLDNALKYAGEGSAVTIALTAKGDGVGCAICDNGPGIAPEDLPHVTQRFYRAHAATEKSAEGSGLGLALVTEILRQHESTLKITSPAYENHGTCASFTLPLAAPPEKDAR